MNAVACAEPTDDAYVVIIELAEGEPPAVDGVGVMLVAQAVSPDSSTMSITLDGTGGTMVDPETDEATTTICIPATDSGQFVLFEPDTDAKGCRVVARLWDQPCGDGGVLLASNSLFFDPQDVADSTEMSP